MWPHGGPDINIVGGVQLEGFTPFSRLWTMATPEIILQCYCTPHWCNCVVDEEEAENVK